MRRLFSPAAMVKRMGWPSLSRKSTSITKHHFLALFGLQCIALNIALCCPAGMRVLSAALLAALTVLQMGWCQGMLAGSSAAFTCDTVCFNSTEKPAPASTGINQNITANATLSPPVFLIGAMKSGTTALSDALYHHTYIHKGIVFPGEPTWHSKELHFFDHNTSYPLGRQYYESRFNQSLPPGHVNLDATPEYLYEPYVAERVFKMYGKDIKILAILRDPVERAVSHWR